MTRFLPLAAGLALALGMAAPALARSEGDFQPTTVASPDTGPEAAGVANYANGSISYNDGTRVAVPQAAAPAPHAANHVPVVQFNDGTRS